MTQSYGQNETMTLGQNDLSNTNVYTINTNNDCNSSIAEITKCYEENIGLITPATAELLFDYLKDMDKDLIIKAIKIASINNKRTARYIQGILNDWNKKGIKTLLDAEKEQDDFKNKNKMKEETQEEANARKLKALEEMMKNDIK